MPIVRSEGGIRKVAPRSTAKHVELVQSIFMLGNAFDDLKALWMSGDRSGFGAKMLSLMLPASSAASVEELKESLKKTANEEEVKAVQRMLFSMMDLDPPPAMMGAVWAQ